MKCHTEFFIGSLQFWLKWKIKEAVLGSREVAAIDLCSSTACENQKWTRSSRWKSLKHKDARTSVVCWLMFVYIYSHLSFSFCVLLSFIIPRRIQIYPRGNKVAATSVTHTLDRASFLPGYDCLLITSLLWGHLCVTPIKHDGSHCGWDNISTYLHLSQKQIKTDMWADCHCDTWAFPRKPAKSCGCRWVITFWFSLTTATHRLHTFVTVCSVKFPSSPVAP